MTPKEIKDIVPIDKVYEDAVKPAMKQIGLALESVAKTSRFLLAPIDYLASQHDRWQRHLYKLAQKVDDSNLIEGHPQMVLPILEGLSLSSEETILSELFINLLAASIDNTKQGLAHPSFPNIIKHLSFDQAVMLYYIKKGFGFVNEEQILRRKYSYPVVILESILRFPEQSSFYFEHLKSLNLIDFEEMYDYLDHPPKRIEITRTGVLFMDACVPNVYEDFDSKTILPGD
jgi:hypothetical protein